MKVENAIALKYFCIPTAVPRLEMSMLN